MHTAHSAHTSSIDSTPHVVIAKMQKGDGISNGFMGHQAKWFISVFCVCLFSEEGKKCKLS